MKLHELLTPNRIILDLEAKKRESVIESLVDLLANADEIEDADAVKRMVIAREHEVGTGIGFGVAIPHAEPGHFPKPLAALARLSKGVDFHSPDRDVANLVFLLLTPDKMPALHVRLLARICRLFKSDTLRKKLFKAGDPGEVADIIADAEADFPELMP